MEINALKQAQAAAFAAWQASTAASLALSAQLEAVRDAATKAADAPCRGFMGERAHRLGHPEGLFPWPKK